MPEERIMAEALSGFGCVRVTVSLRERTVEIERWSSKYRVKTRDHLDASAIEALRSLAAAVRQEEQELVVGDFYAMGEERLRVVLAGRTVEIHNDSDRIRTPRAGPVMDACWKIADRLLPPPK